MHKWFGKISEKCLSPTQVMGERVRVWYSQLTRSGSTKLHFLVFLRICHFLQIIGNLVKNDKILTFCYVQEILEF